MILESVLIVSGFLALTFLIISKKIINRKRKELCMEKFKDYQSILEYFMDKAFEIVYKDRVFTYSLEATRPRESEIDVISQDFVKLTQKFLGPMMLGELVFMYGGEEAFTVNVLNYFSIHYEEDEIRQTALAGLSGANEEI